MKHKEHSRLFLSDLVLYPKDNPLIIIIIKNVGFSLLCYITTTIQLPHSCSSIYSVFQGDRSLYSTETAGCSEGSEGRGMVESNINSFRENGKNTANSGMQLHTAGYNTARFQLCIPHNIVNIWIVEDQVPCSSDRLRQHGFSAVLKELIVFFCLSILEKLHCCEIRSVKSLPALAQSCHRSNTNLISSGSGSNSDIRWTHCGLETVHIESKLIISAALSSA